MNLSMIETIIAIPVVTHMGMSLLKLVRSTMENMTESGVVHISQVAGTSSRVIKYVRKGDKYSFSIPCIIDVDRQSKKIVYDVELKYYIKRPSNLLLYCIRGGNELIPKFHEMYISQMISLYEIIISKTMDASANIDKHMIDEALKRHIGTHAMFIGSPSLFMITLPI